MRNRPKTYKNVKTEKPNNNLIHAGCGVTRSPILNHSCLSASFLELPQMVLIFHMQQAPDLLDNYLKRYNFIITSKQVICLIKIQLTTVNHVP